MRSVKKSKFVKEYLTNNYNNTVCNIEPSVAHLKMAERMPTTQVQATKTGGQYLSLFDVLEMKTTLCIRIDFKVIQQQHLGSNVERQNIDRPDVDKYKYEKNERSESGLLS